MLAARIRITSIELTDNGVLVTAKSAIPIFHFSRGLQEVSWRIDLAEASNLHAGKRYNLNIEEVI